MRYGWRWLLAALLSLAAFQGGTAQAAGADIAAAAKTNWFCAVHTKSTARTRALLRQAYRGAHTRAVARHLSSAVDVWDDAAAYCSIEFPDGADGYTQCLWWYYQTYGGGGGGGGC